MQGVGKIICEKKKKPQLLTKNSVWASDGISIKSIFRSSGIKEKRREETDNLVGWW